MIEFWYCIGKNGIATLCRDEQDAKMECIRNDVLWPSNAPHWFGMMVKAAPVATGCDRCSYEDDGK